MKTRKRNTFTRAQLHRLLIMADHFSEGKMFEKYGTGDYFNYEWIACEILGNRVTLNQCPFYLSELPYLFAEQWILSPQKDFIIYKPEPLLTLSGALMDFTGLRVKQFMHCFVLGSQNEKKYGGQKLHSHFQPKDVAYNIYSLIERYYPLARRMVLVEKYKSR